MGALFKSLLAVKKKPEDKNEKLKAQLEKDILELEPKLKILDKEREQKLIEYNKLSTGVLRLAAELENARRKLKHLKVVKTSLDEDLMDESDYD